MADERIVIEIELDDGSVIKGFANIQDHAEKAGKNIKNSFGGGGGSGGAMNAFEDSLKGVAIAFAALAAAALAAGVVLKKIFSAAIEESSKYDTALNQLNIALSQTGQFTKEASVGFEEYAASIQATTKFSDEAVLSSAALIQQLGHLSGDGLKKAESAALDLSAALGIDLTTASQLVGKAAEGNVSGLQRLGLQISKGSSDAQTYANALQALSRFQGAAAQSANTFEGSLAQLSNNFNDLLKRIGQLATRSPALLATFKEISKAITGFTSTIGSKIGGQDIFKDMIINFSIIAQTGIETARRIGLSFELAFARAGQALKAFQVLSTAGLSSAFNQQLKEASDNVDKIKAEFNDTPESIVFFDNLIMKVQQTSGVLTELSDKVKNTPLVIQTAFDETKLAIDNFALGFTGAYDLAAAGTVALANQVQAAKDRIVGDFKKIGESARQGLGTSIGQGFAAFGKALAKGENALAAFAKAFLSSIGNAAIATGTEMILRGIGYSFDPILMGFGPGLIAAGAALATFGGVLSAVGGGGGGGAPSGAAGGGASVQELPVGSPELNTKPKEPTTTNSLIIHGDVLDSDETSNRIVNLLRDFTDKNGQVLTTA